MAQKLILFDFDGTLTTKDTMIEFIKFVRGSNKLYLGYALISPTLIGMKLGMIPNDKAKERLLTHHFKGMSQSALREKATAFGQEVIPGLLRPQGKIAFQEYQEAGHRVIVVSASLDLWLQPYFESQGIEYLCTAAEYASGTFTGKLAGANCNGEEKVRRIQAHVKVADYEEVIAYGDSSGDEAMLGMAGAGHFKPFRG